MLDKNSKNTITCLLLIGGKANSVTSVLGSAVSTWQYSGLQLQLVGLTQIKILTAAVAFGRHWSVFLSC